MTEGLCIHGADTKSDTPLITVAIPVFNAGKYLRLAVLSIVGQTFKDWELLIIDDGSSDDSLESISDIQDPRIRVIRDGNNRGLATRLNEAVDLGRGKYFARMDQDDFSYPERFACQLAFLEAHPEVDFVAARAITISDDNELTGILPSRLLHQEICARPWLGFYLPHPTWFGHRSWFRQHRYTSPGPYFCEDQDLLLRSFSSSRFATVDQVLFGYRLRRRINLKKQVKTRWTLYKIQWKHFVASGDYSYALLSTLAFIGRVGSDQLGWLLQRWQNPVSVPPSVDGTEIARWRQVLSETAWVS